MSQYREGSTEVEALTFDDENRLTQSDNENCNNRNKRRRTWVTSCLICCCCTTSRGAAILKPQLSCCQWTLAESTPHGRLSWFPSSFFFLFIFCGTASAVPAEFEPPANSSRRCADRLQSGNQINCSGFIVEQKRRLSEPLNRTEERRTHVLCCMLTQ